MGCKFLRCADSGLGNTYMTLRKNFNPISYSTFTSSNFVDVELDYWKGNLHHNFLGNTKLEKFVLKNTTGAVGMANPFGSCSSLKRVEMTDATNNCTSEGRMERFFQYCTDLEYVDRPA